MRRLLLLAAVALLPAAGCNYLPEEDPGYEVRARERAPAARAANTSERPDALRAGTEA
jgi:hypothetical protein